MLRDCLYVYDHRIVAKRQGQVLAIKRLETAVVPVVLDKSAIVDRFGQSLFAGRGVQAGPERARSAPERPFKAGMPMLTPQRAIAYPVQASGSTSLHVLQNELSTG